MLNHKCLCHQNHLNPQVQMLGLLYGDDREPPKGFKQGYDKHFGNTSQKQRRGQI